jgi:hypothetical protein
MQILLGSVIREIAADQSELTSDILPVGRVARGGVGTIDPRQDRVRVRQLWLAG